MDGYHIYEEIGRGQHSLVYKGREKQTVQYVAIKSVDKSKIEKVLQEVRVQHKLSHPNCLRFFKWYETRHHIWLILEFATGGSLLELLRHDGRLPESAARVFGADLVHGLLYLHSNGVLHCDLKPSNVLLNEYGVLKLSDFALSMTLDQLNKMANKSKKRGTPCYMAPELFTDEGVPSVASDLWSLGVVLYELVIGEPPFVSRSFSELVQLVQTSPLELPAGDELSVSFKNLLRSLLRKDPAKRISWPALLTHDFWEGMPLPAFTRVPHNPAYQHYMDSREYIPSCVEEDSDPEIDDPNESTLSGLPEEDSLRMSANARRNLLRESVESASGAYLRRSVSIGAPLVPVTELDTASSQENTGLTAVNSQAAPHADHPNDEKSPAPCSLAAPPVTAADERASREPRVPAGDLELENTDTVFDFEYRPDTPIEGDEDDDSPIEDDEGNEDQERHARQSGTPSQTVAEDPESSRNRFPASANDAATREESHDAASDDTTSAHAEEAQLDLVSDPSSPPKASPSAQDSEPSPSNQRADPTHQRGKARASSGPLDAADQSAREEDLLAQQNDGSILDAVSASTTRPTDAHEKDNEHAMSRPEEAPNKVEQDETKAEPEAIVNGNASDLNGKAERPRTAPQNSATLSLEIDTEAAASPRGGEGGFTPDGSPIRPATAEGLGDRTSDGLSDSLLSAPASPGPSRESTKRPSVQEAAAAVLALATETDENSSASEDERGESGEVLMDPLKSSRVVRAVDVVESEEQAATGPVTPPGSPSPGPSSLVLSPSSVSSASSSSALAPPDSAAEPALRIDPDVERRAKAMGENRTLQLLHQQRMVLVPELVQQEFRGAGEVQAQLMDSHDFVIRPIVGNPITTALPVLKYNPRMLPFPNLAAHDAARLDGPELEVFFSQVFRALSSGPENSAAQVIQTLGYLYSLCTTPRLANVIVSSSLVALLIRLGTKPETIINGGAGAGGHGAAGARSPPRSPRTPRGGAAGSGRGGLGRPVTPPSPPSGHPQQHPHAASALGPDLGDLSSPSALSPRQFAASMGPGHLQRSQALGSSFVNSPALSMSGMTSTHKKASLKSQIRKLRVRVTIVLAVLVRHATFIAPRLNDEGLLEAFTAFSQDEEVLPIRRYGSAGLGELLFYITANAPPAGDPGESNQSSSGSPPGPTGALNGAAIDQWKISGAALKQLSSCLHSTDETVRFYAAKTYENVLSLAPAAEQVAQGANTTSLRFATAEVASRLLNATLREKAEHLRSTCAMALAHLVRLNRRLLPRLAEHDAWEFMVNGLQAVHGSPRVQQAFLNILNLVLHSSGSGEALVPVSPMRSMPAATRLGAERTTREALFGRRSEVKEGVLRALIQLLSHGQTFVVRSKAIVTLTLFLQHYPSELHLLLDNKLVQILDRLHSRLRQAARVPASSSAPSAPSGGALPVAEHSHQEQSKMKSSGWGALVSPRGDSERGAVRRGHAKMDDLIAREGAGAALMMRRSLYSLVYRLAMVANEASSFVTKAAGRLAPVVASGRAVTASSPEAGILQRLGRDSLPLLLQLSASRSLSAFVCCNAALLGATATLIRVNLNVASDGFEDFQRYILLLAESLTRSGDALRMPEVALAVGRDLLPALWAASLARQAPFDTKTWCLRLAIEVLCSCAQDARAGSASSNSDAEEENAEEEEEEEGPEVDYFRFEDAVYGGEGESLEAYRERAELLQAINAHVFAFLVDRVLPRAGELLHEEAPVTLMVVNLLCFAVSKRPEIVRDIEALGLLADFANLLPAERADQHGSVDSPASSSGATAPRTGVDTRALAGAKLISSVLYAGASLWEDENSLVAGPGALPERAARFARLVLDSISIDEEARLQSGRARALMSAQFRQQHEEQQLEAVVDLFFPLLQVMARRSATRAALGALDDGAVLACLALAVERALGVPTSATRPSTEPWADWISQQPLPPGEAGIDATDDDDDEHELLEAPVPMVIGDLSVLLEKSCACLAMMASVLPRSARVGSRMLTHRRFVSLLVLVLRASLREGGIAEDWQSRVAASMHIVELLDKLAARATESGQGNRFRSRLQASRGALADVLSSTTDAHQEALVSRVLEHLDE